MCLKKLKIKSNIRDYEVIFCNAKDILSSIKFDDNTFYIVDINVWSIYSKSTLNFLEEDKLILLEASENKKNLNTVQNIYDQLILKNPKKNLTIITIGGGISQDISGFVTSTLYRGIKWLFFPTTLLAQADSCIGSKTSLNYKEFKNLLGTFYPPTCVYIDTEFLKSLSEYDYFSGIGEIAKLHLMGGCEKAEYYFNSINSIKHRDIDILEELITNSLSIKSSFMMDDEFDTGKRNLLNYGHCFGHAIESATDFEISHGQAVIAGMILANNIANNKGLLSNEKHGKINNNLSEILYKKQLLKKMNPELIISGLKKDKKRVTSELPLVMLHTDYSLSKITNLTIEEANNSIIKFIDQL